MAHGNGASSGLFKLDLSERKPFWLEVLPAKGGHGAVELLVKPYDTRILYASMFEALAMRSDLKDMVESKRSTGENPSPEQLAAALKDEAWTKGEQTFDQILTLSKRVVLDWRGVGWSYDEPIPFTTERLETFFFQAPEAAQTFNIKYEQHSLEFIQEKKVSENGHAGTADAAETTAGDAQTAETHALQVESEPSGSALT